MSDTPNEKLEEEYNKRKGLVIFGRDLTQVPCFRNSFLYGICGGVATGLARFMFTSKPKSAADFAVGAFVLVTMGNWFPCRYQYSKMKMEMDQTKHLLRQHITYEGTEMDEQNKFSNENVPVEV